MTLETTLHNISINPASMDGPADGEIFGSNYLGEIADIQSKLAQNLAKVGETYHHLHAHERYQNHMFWYQSYLHDILYTGPSQGLMLLAVRNTN